MYPLTGLTANSGRKSLERTPCPAIDTDATCCTSIGMAPDQALPPSVDRITEAVKVEPLPHLDPVNGHLPPWLVIRLMPSISTPRAGPVVGTTIWLPMVWSFWPGSKMARPVLQVTPLSVVRENIAGPRKAAANTVALGLAFVCGDSRRSQTA